MRRVRLRDGRRWTRLSLRPACRTERTSPRTTRDASARTTRVDRRHPGPREPGGRSASPLKACRWATTPASPRRPIFNAAKNVGRGRRLRPSRVGLRRRRRSDVYTRTSPSRREPVRSVTIEPPIRSSDLIAVVTGAASDRSAGRYVRPGPEGQATLKTSAGPRPRASQPRGGALLPFWSSRWWRDVRRGACSPLYPRAVGNARTR